MNTKYRIFTTLIVAAILATSLVSCLKSDDLITKDAKTGGLIDATYMLQYKPGSTQSVDVDFMVYLGPAVQQIDVYKVFYHAVDGVESDQVFLRSVSVDGQNSSDTLILTESFTWSDLSQNIPQLSDGYNVPSDPTTADVGDFFILKYVSVMTDGRQVIDLPETYIVVANFFAGYYSAHLMYFHPTLGGSYPDDPYYEDTFQKELFTITNSECMMNFALWGSYNETMYIQINFDNTISIAVDNFDYIVKEGDPYDPTKVSHYDPVSQIIYLYYYYEASGGYRVFWETLTP